MDPTLTHYGDEISESVDALEQSVAGHREAVLGEMSLMRMGSMERAHMDDVATHMAGMQDAQDSIESCGDHMAGSRHAEHMDDVQALHDARGAMADVMQDVENASEHHMKVMLAAPDLEAALAEERRHQAEMEDLMGMMSTHEQSMGRAMHAMADDGFSMTCPMSSHMHRAR